MSEPVALIDMDGTLCDFAGAMDEALMALMSPLEKMDAVARQLVPGDPSETKWLKARKRLIKAQPGFWRNLAPIPEGFAVLEHVRRAGFSLNILTKGPFRTTSAWSEKVDWVRQYVPDAKVTITEDKGLVYGRVLFDDWPPYIERWLEWRPRGLVVMLDHSWNQDFQHPNVFRYRRLSGDDWQKQEAALAEKLEEAANR